ncbi:MAG: type II secretion system F family protein [Butyrivibrio sp.]
MIEGVGILLAIGFLFYNNVLAGLVFFPYLFFYVRKRIKEFENKRREKLAVEFKDGMQAVVSALIAGYSIENAFREAVGELELMYGRKTEIYKGFLVIINQLNLNVSIEEAFSNFAKECRVEEITGFAQVLYYAKRNGGNLIQIIKNTSDTISEKIEVKREINTAVSAKRLEQNIMNLVPVGIILYMRITSAGMIEKLYGNIYGIIIMTFCLIIYFAAKVIADKIVDIKV